MGFLYHLTILKPRLKATNYLPLYENSHALVIGVDKYRYVAPLANACADATSVADALVRDLGFPKENVAVVLNCEATGVRIRERFLALESLRPNDRLVLFFAGHGETLNGHHGPIGYLIPVDGNPHDRSTFIRWKQWIEDADLILAKHILFIFDSCFSGLAMQRSTHRQHNRFVSEMLQRRSRQVITAGKADQPVSDSGGPTGKNSIFTGHFLKGLSGAAAHASGVLTASYLMDYVYREVSNDPISRQTPHFGHVDGDGDMILRMSGESPASGETLTDAVVESIPERPEPASLDATASIKPVFAERIGYADPESETFGKNDWTARLGAHLRTGKGKAEFRRASHWLSIVAEPVSAEVISLDIATLNRTLRGQAPAVVKHYDQLRLPSQTITTSKCLVLYDDLHTDPKAGRELWKRFLRIEASGAMEYCGTQGVSGVYWLAGPDESKQGQSFRVFSYIRSIGVICNAVFAMKRILDTVSYGAGIRLLVSFVATKDSVMVDFAKTTKQGGPHWLQPFETEALYNNSLGKWRCHEANLQFGYDLVLASLGEPEANRIIQDCAHRLGLAYNHQSEPRCFIHGTNTFPWNEFDTSAVQ